MDQKEPQPYGVAKIQIFEVTMDNAEDQDELNRRFQKSCAAYTSPPALQLRLAHLARKGVTGPIAASLAVLAWEACHAR